MHEGRWKLTVKAQARVAQLASNLINFHPRLIGLIGNFLCALAIHLYQLLSSLEQCCIYIMRTYVYVPALYSSEIEIAKGS